MLGEGQGTGSIRVKGLKVEGRKNKNKIGREKNSYGQDNRTNN